MATLAHVVFFTLVGSLFSLAGGFYLIANRERAKRLALYATPFAAGALLGAAFMDLLPEAVESGSAKTALLFTLIGILGFFLLERFMHWFHHHHENEESSKLKAGETIPLIIIGDILHNFIDGIVIAAGFLVSVETGAVVTLAVAAHEIPQEIGDFGLLLSKGMRRRSVILVNVFSAVITTIAAVLFFHFGKSTVGDLDILLGLVAGFFIYIATSDIIPTLHKTKNNRLAAMQTLLLILGASVVGVLTTVIKGMVST